MTKEEEQPEEQSTILTSDQKNKVLLIDGIIRMNKDYIREALEVQETLTLEALYKAEQLRINAAEKPEPKAGFISAPISKKPIPSKKENVKPEEYRFNSLEVFKPQYTPVERLNKFDDSCEVFSLRVHTDPRLPEWKL